MTNDLIGLTLERALEALKDRGETPEIECISAPTRNGAAPADNLTVRVVRYANGRLTVARFPGSMREE